jgi:hypothetical protein
METCKEYGIDPDETLKHLMADFIQQAKEAKGREDQGPGEGIQELVERRKREREVILTED